MNLRILSLLVALFTLPRPALDLDDHAELDVRGWTVRVHPELARADSALGREVLELLDQPWMVLHELAHAYHHQALEYSHEGIAKAFAAARESGSYEEILRCNGNRERAYGMNNAQEYFAELSEAYFGVNDFYPFVRAEVREFDPAGFEVLESAWGR
jgi:hypothetical protein